MVNSATTVYRVLHVDDDIDFLDLTRARLDRVAEDIELVSETSAGVALDRLAREVFDCVVTDYRMDGVDGLEFLEQLRAREADLPVIFLTGMGSEDLASEAIAMGVTDYLRKSGNENQFVLLANRVRTLCSRRAAEREAALAAALVEETYERITEGVLSIDTGGWVTYLNSHAAGLLGLTDDELLDESLFLVAPELTGTAFQDGLVAAIRDGEPVTGEVELEDREVWLSFTVYPAEDGVTVFLRDDTELKRFEAENEGLRSRLETSESRFRSLQNKVSRPVPAFRA